MTNSYEEAVAAMIEENSIPDELPPCKAESCKEETEESAEEELRRLRAELALLREEMEKKEQDQLRAVAELEEFQHLFPSVPLKQIPPSVWEQVSTGIPLSAAYALYEKKSLAAEQHAHKINKKNAALSAGMAGTDASEEYFSPQEVRAMSQREVHENYAKILESMKSWG